VRRYPHALREESFAGRYGPLMPIDFDQAQPAIAERLQAGIITQCRKANASFLSSLQYGEICREFLHTPVDRDERDWGPRRFARFDPSRDIANSGLLQH